VGGQGAAVFTLLVPGTVVEAVEVVQEFGGEDALGVVVMGEGVADVGEQVYEGRFPVVLLLEDFLEGGAGLFRPVATDGVGQGEEDAGGVLLVGGEAGQILPFILILVEGVVDLLAAGRVLGPSLHPGGELLGVFRD